MNTLFRVSLAFLGLLIVAGCSSPSSRIGKNRAAFDTYPAEVQAKIRAGEVAVGFTPEQVKMAQGKPDRILELTTAAATSEVWVYLDDGSGVSFGVGMGFGGGSTMAGGGVGVGGDSVAANERLRVTFVDGRVTAIERKAKKQ